MRPPGGHHKSGQAAFTPAALVGLILTLSLACLNAYAAAPSPIATLANDTEIVVMLDLDGEPLVESFVVTEQNGKVSIPVCALAEALSLAISCLDQKAYGYILQESRPFVIDLEERYVISGRNVFRTDDSAYMQDADLFVDIRELSKWLPLDFVFQPETSTVRMHSRELLPVQSLRKRQQFRPAPSPSLPKQCEDFTPPRTTLAVPTLDMSSQLLISGQDHAARQTVTRNSLDMSGDLLYMSGEAHLFAEDKSLKRLDAKLYRRSAVGFKVAPLPVTQLGIGAVQAPFLDGIGAPAGPMYGLYLSNRPILGGSNFQSHEVHGHLPPGWDAELFHNGTQVGYQPPTRDGMYHFVNLRVYYGLNNFKVVLHGPFGERRESEELFVSDSVTPTGEFLYTVSAGWQTGLTPTDSAGQSRESNVTMTSDFGVAKNLTGSAVLARHRNSLGEERDYAGVGVRTALRNTLLSLDLIESFAPKNGRNGQLLTVRSSSRAILSLNLEVVQRFLHDFDSPHFPPTKNPLWSQTSIKANSSFTLWNKVRIPYSMEIGLDARESEDLDATSQWRISGGWNGWNAVLEADVSYLQGTTYATGLVQVSTRVKDLSVRGQAGVSIAPTFTASAVNLNADKELGREFLLNTGLFYDPASNTSGFRIGLSKRFGLLGYSVSVTGSTNGVYGVDVGVRSSFAADRVNRQAIVSAEPLSLFGMIAVSAAAADTGECTGKPLPGVGFLVNGNRATTITGSKGWPVIAFLQPDIPVDVTVDLTTIEDPFMVPLEDGCRIIPRAGVVSACRFTMTTGGEIDGMVFARVNQTNEVPLKGVRVDLVAQGVNGSKLQASTRSEESGYYLFKTVKPGNYRVVVPDEELARLGIAAVSPVAVTMPVGGDMVSGQDVLIDATVDDKKDVSPLIAP